MRILIRVLVGAVVLVALALGGLALLLPRLIDSPAVRERIQQAAEASLGRKVTYEGLSFGLVPPRLVMRRPVVAGPQEGDPATLEAESFGLRLALAPLLARALVIESLRVDGATLRLIRTEEGIELPVAKSTKSAPSDAPPEGAAAEPEAGGSSLQLAVRDVALRGARVVLEDRTVTPAVTWDLGSVDAGGRAESLEGPIPFQFSAVMASGGALRASGTFQVQGGMDATLVLDGLVLAPAAPYLGEKQRLVGTLSGEVRASGEGLTPDRVVADLSLEGGDLQLDEMALRGRLLLKADLKGVPDAAAGNFEIDATQAAVTYSDVFTKPAGTEGTVSGRIVPQPDGSLGIDDVRLHVRNLDAEASVRTGKRLRLDLSAPRFDVAGWENLLPALAGRGLAGGLRVEKLAIETVPVEVRGRVHLDDLRVAIPDAGSLRLRGAIDAEGTNLRTRDLTVETEEQTLTIDGDVSRLDKDPRYDVKVRTKDADTNRLLSTFTSTKDTLYGLLDLEGQFAGPLGGSRPLASTVKGGLQMNIGKGRLKGVSLLKSTFERMGKLGEFALLAGALSGGRTLQRFYEDEFESISGNFDISGGRARTENLQLVYRHYRVDLSGTLNLLDLALDATGKLTIDPDVDKVLAAEAASAGAGSPSGGQPRVIPLARVTGTLSDPKVDLSPQAVATLARQYTTARYTGKYEKKIDEALGEGSGKQVIDALEGLLGGRRR